MSFSKDFSKGNTAEKFVKDILEKSGADVQIVNLPEYDLNCKYFCENEKEVNQSVVKHGSEQYNYKPACNCLEFTVEVKFDIKSVVTKNIAIEYENAKSHKPSGITLSKADIWCIVIPKGQVWICSLDKLKRFVEDVPPFKTIIAGGDDNANLYLYKMHVILKEFTRLDTLPIDEVEQVVRNVIDGNN